MAIVIRIVVEVFHNCSIRARRVKKN